MCVMAWAWRAHPRCPLVVLANRDERHRRPSAPLDWWTEAPDVLAGRDLEAGGTWLGITRSGRFAAITNRDGEKPPNAPSRGELTRGFLLGAAGTAETAAAIAPDAPRYAGFNLLLGAGDALAFVSNREPDRALRPGVHAMANGALDEEVCKVRRLTNVLHAWIESAQAPQPEAWLALLADTGTVDGRAESAIFVRGDDNGTRSSTVVVFGDDRSATVIERSFDPRGTALGTASFEFTVTA